MEILYGGAANLEEVFDVKMIVGLGNPGARYEVTRHNVGFMAVDLLAEKLDIDFKKQEHFSVMAEGRLGQEKVILLKPLTYMNLSGQAVVSAVNFFKLDLKDVIVVYDDMDLEVGRLRVRANGSAGGHKGMGSIIRLTGSQEISRVRIGIGRPGREAVSDYVLMRFPDSEWEPVKDAICRASDAAYLWLKEGIVAAMNKYNSCER